MAITKQKQYAVSLKVAARNDELPEGSRRGHGARSGAAADPEARLRQATEAETIGDLPALFGRPPEGSRFGHLPDDAKVPDALKDFFDKLTDVLDAHGPRGCGHDECGVKATLDLGVFSSPPTSDDLIAVLHTELLPSLTAENREVGPFLVDTAEQFLRRWPVPPIGPDDEGCIFSSGKCLLSIEVTDVWVVSSEESSAVAAPSAPVGQAAPRRGRGRVSGPEGFGSGDLVGVGRDEPAGAGV
jgi:hypothetical protein